MKVDMNKTSHIFLQDKGGIGKTLTASMFCQWLRSRGFNVGAVDIDQQSPKLSRISALNAPLLPLLQHGEIQQSAFDKMIHAIVKSTVPTVIDTGSGAFLPLLKYLKDNDTFEIFDQFGVQLFFHVVIISGPEKEQTVEGAKNLINNYAGKNTKVVIWQNEKEGIPLIGGKIIEESDFYIENQETIQGVVKIIDRNNSSYVGDMLAMMGDEVTHSQIMSGQAPKFDFIRANRINKIFTAVYDELDNVLPISTQAKAKGK